MKRRLCVAFLLFLLDHQALAKHKRSRQNSTLNSMLVDKLKDKVEGDGETIPRERLGCQCGVANRKRIIGGGEVSPMLKYPWVVGIKPNSIGRFICEGSIINDRWILTAAHCVVEIHKELVMPLFETYPLHKDTCKIIDKALQEYKVRVGEHNQDDPNDDIPDTTKDYSISKIVQHYRYNCKASNRDLYNFVRYDFAVIKIKGSIDFTGKIRPVCLPNNNIDDYAGRDGNVIGWGITVENSPSDTRSPYLKEVQVKIQANPSGMPEEKISAKSVVGSGDTCPGDSGGPLMVVENNIYVQIGVVSYGFSCGVTGIPGVYARVSKVLDWIRISTKTGWKCG